jgi:molybdopterin synthase catalytic subunit
VNSQAGNDWISVADSPLSPESLTSWATRPDCGAVVTFIGVARSSSTREQAIEALEYDTSVELAEQRISQVIEITRSHWPMLGSIAIHHRIGMVRVGEPAVVISLSSPHRQAAYEASQFCIDTVKKCVPMWKREIWEGGSAWSDEAQDLLGVQDL